MAIANDGKPLTIEQRQAEEARLKDLMNNPEELKRKRQREKDDAERVGRIVRAMPDAFLFEYDGVEAGSRASASRIRTRSPKIQAESPVRSSHAHRAGTRGHARVLLIDPNKYRIARIDGTLFKEVGFGWGFLAISIGRRFLVEQGDVATARGYSANGSHVHGKLLFFKRSISSPPRVFSDFHPVPTPHVRSGSRVVKEAESGLAEIGRGAGARSRTEVLSDASGDAASRVSTSESFFLHGQLFNQILPHAVAGSGLVANRNQPFPRYFDFRFDDVFLPIARRRKRLRASGSCRAWTRLRCACVRSGFEHSAAPHRDIICLADVVNFLGLGEATDSANLDVDDPAGAGFDGTRRVRGPARSIRRGRWRCAVLFATSVVVEVVFQRLLDHEAVELVELAQVLSVTPTLLHARESSTCASSTSSTCS